MSTSVPGFPHEQLICYRIAVGVARWITSARFPPRCSALHDQAIRASQSVVLNIAESRARGGDAARNHLRMALGSAAEVCAVLDLVDIPGVQERQEELRRVGRMLRGLGA